MGDMPIHERKICALVMEIRMHIILLRASGSLPVIEKPDQFRSTWERGEAHGMIRIARLVDMLV